MALEMEQGNLRVILLDETSFCVQAQPIKFWQSTVKPLTFPIPLGGPHNLNLFGAFSTGLPRLAFMIEDTTTTVNFLKFLVLLRANIDLSDGRMETHLVLDNHTAHRALAVREYIEQDAQLSNHRFILEFMPPYSC